MFNTDIRIRCPTLSLTTTSVTSGAGTAQHSRTIWAHPIFSGISCCSLNMFFMFFFLFVSLFVLFLLCFFFLRPLHFLSFDLLHPTLFIYSTQTFLKKCIQWGYTSDPVPYKHSNDMYIQIRISTLKMNKKLIIIEISIQSKL